MRTNERSLVAITGTGGSGKSKLAGGLMRGLTQPGFPVEHVSIGEYVREQAQQVLARGVLASHYRQTIIDHLNSSPLEPFDPDIAMGIAAECLQLTSARLILFDGFPRFRGQLDQLFELSIRDDIVTRGIIETYVNEEEAVKRMVKRNNERSISAEDAHRRYTSQKLGIEAVRTEISEFNLPHTRIDTSFPKERSLIEGFKLIKELDILPSSSYPLAI